MEKVLVAWLGHADIDAATGRDGAGLGPIAGAVAEREFDRLELLSNQGGERERAFLGWLEERGGPATTLHRVDLDDPTDFGAIYEIDVGVVDAVLAADADTELTFHLSPGTPAMAAVWILLARTRYGAALLQSSPEAGVQTVRVPFEIHAEFLPELVRAIDRDIGELTRDLPPAHADFDRIVHRSEPMRRALALARRVAMHDRDVPVLLQGESGTGKELFARAIHSGSPRAEGPLQVVNCGAIAESVLESELFGHTKGAFTGATAARRGHFEAAEGGTIFLDEIGELTKAAQVRLLRVLQDGEITPVGSSRARRVDVRVIAATNRDLYAAVAAGDFREDLFFRVAVGVVQLPPLRERPGDVGLLTDHFLAEINGRAADLPLNARPKKLTAGARNLLQQHGWPGNVRELRHTLRRAWIWSPGETLRAEDIRQAILERPRPVGSAGPAGPDALGRPIGDGFSLPDLIDEVKRHYLVAAMTESGNNKTRASERLGLGSYQRLTGWLKKYGME